MKTTTQIVDEEEEYWKEYYFLMAEREEFENQLMEEIFPGEAEIILGESVENTNFDDAKIDTNEETIQYYRQTISGDTETKS